MTTISFHGIAFARSDAESPPSKTEARKKVDLAALRFQQTPSQESISAYSLAVFQWGQGMRVYAKLHLPKWEHHTFKWLTQVQNLSVEQALVAGTYKGVGVSFLSKHLRLLDPNRFVTLDSVIEEKLGYARNTAGYMRFLSDLTQLKKEHQLQCSVGDLEEAIYLAIKNEKKRMSLKNVHAPT